MNSLTLRRLVLKRLSDDRTLLASIFVSIAIAATLVAASPVYLKALERLALNLEIDALVRPFSNVHVYGSNILLTSDKLRETDRAVEDGIDRHLQAIYDRRERYLIVDDYLAGLPHNPLPRPGSPEPLASRAYLRHLTNLEHHLLFMEGRMAGSTVSSGPAGPAIEAVVGMSTATSFDLRVGDEITLATHLAADKKIHVRIVGLVAATDPTEDYWMPHASAFLDPRPPDEGPVDDAVEYDPDEPPVPLFITQEAMAGAVGEAYPGSLITSIWYVLVDTEPLKSWSIEEVRRRLDDFEDEVVRAMPGSQVFTGIRIMLSGFEKRRFFSRVPLLLLLAVIAMTLLFYLFMMVSYLIQSRESDVALMRNRGVGLVQLLRLYSVEGLVMAVVAVALAPFLAIGAVALAGITPSFRGMTGGGFLPVEIGPVPFLVAAAAGLVCLLIFVIPSLIGSRAGLLVHRLGSSRPPTMPLFHRYYLDVGLLALGGLIFWELQSRGRFLSGGLFKDIQVNEALLLAPVLFLIVVALVFMRFFPLLVRYIAGESPALLQLATAAIVVVLPPLVVVRALQETDGVGWLVPSALPLAVGVVYWATGRARPLRLRLAGIVLQTLLVWGFVSLEPMTPGQAQFAPTVALISLIPGQIAYLVLRASTRVTPVWLSLGLWQMARNPLRYAWLVLLLVLVTGVGILSTSVGGTLKRSQEDRVKYDVAADVRITGFNGFASAGVQAVRERYLSTPEVTAASLALRHNGRAGPTEFEVLGLESREFPRMSWYREDFSDRPLSTVMLALQSHAQVERLVIPEGASTIGLWAKPEETYPEMYVWTVLQDATGAMRTLSLGTLGPPEWQLLRTRIPRRLQHPVHLVSVQVSEPGIGPNPRQTPGAILLDDIHVTVEANGEEQVLEDFEGQMRWLPILTNALSSDRVRPAVGDVHEGQRAVVFRFGKETVRGIRGFYQSPTGGPMPVVVSAAFARTTGTSINDGFLVEIDGQRLPVVIRDTVRYFPTMGAGGGNFMLAELDNLLSHVNILRPVRGVYPNEVFLSQEPSAVRTVQRNRDDLALRSGDVRDSGELLEAFRRDPFTNAGWGSLVLLALGVVLLATAFGYVTYLLLFSDRSRGEMGFLQSMGLSRRQMTALLAFEHLTVAAIGLGLGTWAGFQMSRLMVSTLAVTEAGEPVLPPFILMTDWSLMAPTYVGLVGILIGALYVLSRSIGRLDLHVISRVEGA